MPITVRDLLGIPRLQLSIVAGKDGLDRPIRWAHTSELEDPTPWLSGGELLLTTGMGLAGPPAVQRDYVSRLVRANLTGLGFGVGFDFDAVPRAVVDAADEEGFPVVEVPYPVPFIAITEAISSRLAQDRLKDAQMSVEVHDRLTSLVSDGMGPADVLDEVASLAGGWAMLFDVKGEVVAQSRAPDVEPPPARAVWATLAPPADGGAASATSVTTHAGTHVALAVVAGKRTEGVLVFGKPGRLDERDRIVVHHAVTVLGLLLASRRAVIEAERRVTGDVLSEAFAGRLLGSDLERRLELAGFPPGAPLTALVIERPLSPDAGALEELSWTIDAALGARSSPVRTAVVGGRVAALVSHSDPEALAQAIVADGSRGALVAVQDDGLRVGVGRAVEAGSIRDSYLAALFALRGAPHKAVASQRDLGSYGFLLGVQPRSLLESFVRSVLGPLIDRDRERSSELVASVRALIEAGGRWEHGAATLGVHRHTLRYRVRQAEEVLGRDLSVAEDRLEVWLALKAAEVLGE